MAGAVFGPDGEPVAGAWVTIGRQTGPQVRPDGTSGQIPPQQFRHTSPEGTFEIGALRPGSTPVLVYALGFAAWKEEVDLVPWGTTSLHVQLQRGAAL